MQQVGNLLTSYLSFFSIGLVDNSSAPGQVNGAINSQNAPLLDLMEATLGELTAGLSSRQFTSVDLVNAYSARIREVNGTLSVVTELNPDAVQIASQLDGERASGLVRGPLHGIPVLVKGSFATTDKMSTSAGSFALYRARPSREATAVVKLRKAGAIVLGKANLSELANYRSINTTNGWSAYGGQCTAAYYPDQDPGGSSSGSAVASSLGLAWAALGTETAGSIVLPADRNDVVGIRPTVGLTSRSLVVPVSQRADTIGPLARTVKDAAHLLQAIAGPDPSDNYTLASPYARGAPLPDYAAACKNTSLAGKRIGVPRNLIFQSPGSPGGATVGAALDGAITQIRALGATVVDNANVTDFAVQQITTGNSLFVVFGVDFEADLPAKYLSKLSSNPDNITNLEQLRSFVQKDPREQWPARDTGRWDAALGLGFDNTSPQFWQNYQLNLEVGGRQGILGVMQNRSLDALILPTTSAYVPAAYVGSPIVSVPLGFYPNSTAVTHSPPPWDGLVEVAPGVPFGLSFLGKAWSEVDLISFAYAYEQATLTRQKGRPYIAPKTQLYNTVQA